MAIEKYWLDVGISLESVSSGLAGPEASLLWTEHMREMSKCSSERGHVSLGSLAVNRREDAGSWRGTWRAGARMLLVSCMCLNAHWRE